MTAVPRALIATAVPSSSLIRLSALNPGVAEFASAEPEAAISRISGTDRSALWIGGGGRCDGLVCLGSGGV